ncbi:MAG TPA: class I SAM-dependent methyltransferase [Bryobacteraceae bacterium]|jgi:SAM-dependent methyltransferase|nr:class I SAM-dependent methyltransferase [Bryobacteraceae bacterium]
MSACLICGATAAAAILSGSDRLYGTTSRQFDVVECSSCGMLRLDPQPPPEELGQYYPSDYWFSPDSSAASRFEEAYRRFVLRDHVHFVSRAIQDSGAKGALLDAGCGGGLFLGMMRERGFRVLGLDYSPKAAAIAWKRQQAPAVCAVLDHAPFRAGTLGALSMFHVLEHLYDPRAYLCAARELLEPAGRLIVQVPNAASWQFRLLGRSWNGIDVPRHLFDYRARDLEKLLASAGFRVVRRKFFNLRDNPAGLASSLAPRLDPMARRVRRIPEGKSMRLAKDLAYFALTIASLPAALAEAAARSGSTVMIEAARA